MSDRAHSSLLLAGRVLLSFIFLSSGVMKLMHWSDTANHMTEKGMVAVPFFLGAAVLLELVGGLSILFGYFVRWGASADRVPGPGQPGDAQFLGL